MHRKEEKVQTRQAPGRRPSKSIRMGTDVVFARSNETMMRYNDGTRKEYAGDRDFIDSGLGALRGHTIETVPPPPLKPKEQGGGGNN